MSARIPPLDPNTTSGPARDIFDSVKGKIGMVPNLYRVLGHSPAALSAYLALNERLTGAKLGPALREKIALAISQENACGYCLSAHTLLATRSGVAPSDVLQAREGHAADPREAAVLRLAVELVKERGRISDQELAKVRAAGLTDGEILEVVALVATLTFSNYVNHVARTPIDFPVAPNLPEEP